MNLNDIALKHKILLNIPFLFDGHRLPADVIASIMLLRSCYQDELNAFEREMQEVAKNLKKEGFDDRTRDISEMEDVDNRLKAYNDWKEGDTDADGKPVERPARPSDEEIAKADKTREGEADYRKELKELEEQYEATRQKRILEEVKVKRGLLKEKEFVAICDLIAWEGTIALKGFTQGDETKVINAPREEFLALVAANVVER